MALPFLFILLNRNPQFRRLSITETLVGERNDLIGLYLLIRV
jgi:hypothetical protein